MMLPTNEALHGGEIRVWWVPQIPMDPFTVLVSSVAEGEQLLDVLAAYDDFQYTTGIKPDYNNTGGIEQFINGEWEEVGE